MRICELKQKEVINIRDGARLGYVFDLEMDLACGKSESPDHAGTWKILLVFFQRK